MNYTSFTNKSVCIFLCLSSTFGTAMAAQMVSHTLYKIPVYRTDDSYFIFV